MYNIGLLAEINEVALLAEGVDRNWIVKVAAKAAESRPPRGGRG